MPVWDGNGKRSASDVPLELAALAKTAYPHIDEEELLERCEYGFNPRTILTKTKEEFLD